MDIENIKPNSHRAKEESQIPAEKKKVKQVVTGKVTKKKNPGRRVANALISEDIENVKSYVVIDVLIPAMKKAISDIVTNGIDMMLYGESGHGKGSRGTGSNVSYRNYYDRKDNDRFSRSRTRDSRAGFSYDDLIIASRIEAEEVLNQMDEMLATYGVVSVADFYEAAGETCDYTANKFGWTSLRSADVIRVRDGYIIKLPKASPIN